MRARQVELNGNTLYCFEPFEAMFLARDVDAYFGHGVKLAPGATVIDVGANIGVFSAEVGRRLGGDVRILAFEPLPPIYEILAKNAQGPIAGKVEAFPFGLGARDETLTFTFFPLLSCLSSSHRGAKDVKTESVRVAASIGQMIKSGHAMPWMAKLPAVMLDAFLESYVKARMKSETHAVRVRTLSAVLDERPIERIDLLKIDVEGAEEEVLAGIEPRHWPLVHQLVMELERFASRVGEVKQMLAGRGFHVEAVQDDAQRTGDYGLVYALRR